MESSSSSTSTSPYHLELFERTKANAFFLLGSILYMPVSTWDFMWEKRGKGNPEDSPSWSWVFDMILISATLSYLANGLLETWTAYNAYKKIKKNALADPFPYGEIINGVLFSTAALVEFCFALVGRNMIWLAVSTHVYVANALLTLYLRRNANMSSMPHRMIRAGDILFLMGASMDVTGTYLERRQNVAAEYTGLWLASSVAWLIDALLYIAADKMSLDEEININRVPKPSDPMMPHGESELVPPTTSTTGTGLSNIV